MARQQTDLESEGAEFLVWGRLLVEKLRAYKMYVNMPGYDILVVDPQAGRQARVSVKSRWRYRADGFPMKNLDNDFVVVVLLNRQLGHGEVAPIQFYVIPTQVMKSIKRSPGWHKVRFADIPHLDKYQNAWDLIRKFISAPNIKQQGQSAGAATKRRLAAG